MRSDLGTVLEEAAAVLRALPREYRRVAEAQRRTQDWRERHPGLRAELLVDQPPGSVRVEYDLLLDHPAGGTLALTWREDEGLPWAVCYADHWAANGVVTVNGQTVTVQQALLLLRTLAQVHPDMLAELVNQQLLRQAADLDKPPVTREELQQAADRFRRALGLHTAADTLRWLEELGLTQERFEAMLEGTVQSYKVKQRVTAEQLDAYFEAHREEYDQVRLFEVRVPGEELAGRLVAEARDGGLLTAVQARLRDPSLPPVEGTLTTRHAGTLPGPLRTAPAGEIIGPHRAGQQYLVAQVYSRQAARFDDETRDAVEQAVYEGWLARQRAAATVQWHWM